MSVSKWRAVRVSVLAAVLLSLAVAPAAALAGKHSQRAHHSLRAPVTDQNFYFVMADRFANGDTANDHGGLPPGKGEGQSGFDPTGKGWYHGGDLKGLTDRSTTSRASGRPRSGSRRASRTRRSSPGQLGRLPRLLDHRLHADRPAPRIQRRPAHARSTRPTARGIKVYFDIITNHTADVIRYVESANGRLPYTSKDEYAVPHGRPARSVRRPRLRRHGHVPALSPTGSRPATHSARWSASPTTRACRTPSATSRSRRWLNDVTPLPQPRRHDVRRRELAVRRLLRARRPVHRGPARRRRA